MEEYNCDYNQLEYRYHHPHHYYDDEEEDYDSDSSLSSGVYIISLSNFYTLFYANNGGSIHLFFVQFYASLLDLTVIEKLPKYLACRQLMRERLNTCFKPLQSVNSS